MVKSGDEVDLTYLPQKGPGRRILPGRRIPPGRLLPPGGREPDGRRRYGRCLLPVK